MSDKPMNVESFNLDHTKVKAPYVRLAGIKTGIHGDNIHKYDMRICQPNQGHMEMPALHSLEHLMAELSRNHSDKVVDISPMGCQTGFYIAMINHDDYDDVLDLIEGTLKDVLAADEVPVVMLWQPALDAVMAKNIDGFTYWFHRQTDYRSLTRTK